MLAYIEGKIIAIDERSAIVVSGGLGWRVFLGANTLLTVQKSETLVKLFLHHNSREDSQDLYGFKTHEELRYFQLLIGVSGVGPRHALLIIDNIPLEEIVGAINSNVSDIFTRVPGIGTKLAKKIVLDLEPKIRKLGLSGTVDAENIAQEEDAVGALRSLGYSFREAKDALAKIPKESNGVKKKIEEALKILGKPKSK